MVKVRKFHGYLAAPEVADKLISPPYDVLNTEEAREMASGNETSFLHVNKPEINLPPETNPYAQEVYDMGKKNLEAFKAKGWLKKDEKARVYLYRQRMGDSVQTGIVACTSIEDYETQKIKKHEHTIKKKEDDRTKLTDVQSANIGPVFLTFKEGDAITARMLEITSMTEPYKVVEADDKVQHTLWLCSEEDSDFFISQFESIPALYVADGHHRTAAAYNVGKIRRDKAIEEGIEITGEEPFNYFMSIIYPENQLHILDYNRVLKSLNGLSSEEFLEKLSSSY